MIIEFKLSGYFVDNPKYETVTLDDEAPAVELPDATILKVKQLKGNALDQYIYEKFIMNTAKEGRVISYNVT
jgi:hypothetical protein